MADKKLGIGNIDTLEFGTSDGNTGSVVVPSTGELGSPTRPIYVKDGTLQEGSSDYVFWADTGSSEAQLKSSAGRSIYPKLASDVNINNNLTVGGIISGSLNTISYLLKNDQWMGDAPYYYNIPLQGITIKHNPIIALDIQTDNPIVADVQRDAFACIDRGRTGEEYIELTCLSEKPNTDIPVTIKIC